MSNGFWPRFTQRPIQVSLQNLIRLLDVKGRASEGFDLSSLLVPVVDVSRLVEAAGGGTLDPQTLETGGNPYWGSTKSGPGVSPQGGTVQLWNSTALTAGGAEGRALLLDWFSVTDSNANTRDRLAFGTTALANLATVGFAKRPGTPVAAGQVRIENKEAVFPGPDVERMMWESGANPWLAQFEIKPAAVLLPLSGLTIYGAGNSAVTVTFQWREVPLNAVSGF